MLGAGNTMSQVSRGHRDQLAARVLKELACEAEGAAEAQARGAGKVLEWQRMQWLKCGR